MSKIVITGANGFIGSLLLAQLELLEHDVHGWVREGSSLRLIPNSLHDRLVKINYRDDAQLRRELEGVEVMIHLAGATKARTLAEYRRHNAVLTERVMRFAGEAGLQQFIVLSSQAAAGVQTGSTLPNEDDECVPLSDYGHSKLEVEKLIREKCTIPWTILRPVSVYGPGDSDFFPYFRMATRGFAIIAGNSQRCFNLVDARDVVNCIVLSILKPEAYRELFFVSDGQKYRMNEFVRAISHAAGRKVKCVPIPFWTLYPITFFCELYSRLFSSKPPVLNFSRLRDFAGQRWLCNAAKATARLGFVPKYPLIRGVGETWRWYREHGWL